MRRITGATQGVKTTGVATVIPACDDGREMMPPDKRDEATTRLTRASRQVAEISRMIDEGRHCTKVLQQIAAVQ